MEGQGFGGAGGDDKEGFFCFFFFFWNVRRGVWKYLRILLLGIWFFRWSLGLVLVLVFFFCFFFL